LAEGCVASAKAFVDIAPRQHCCPRSAMIEGEALQEWFATPERRIIFDLNDFDETSPAPWEWDLKRLAASIVLAGRSVGLRNSNNRDCGSCCSQLSRAYSRIFENELASYLVYQPRRRIYCHLPKALRKAVKKRVERLKESDVRLAVGYKSPTILARTSPERRAKPAHDSKSDRPHPE